MLKLTNIGKTVGGKTHIDGVSLTLERGSVNVLLGPTLAGKTTLMRLMAGLERPGSGTISMDGEDVTGLSVKRRDVAMVYQQFINYPSLTVYENIASPLRIAGLDKATLDRKVLEAADLLKLTPYLERTPLNLSGGQQQRTAIARALVKGAGLVLLDEPLANLDYKLREELRVELPRLFAESGAIFVYATTEPHEALLLGGQTATLHEGRVTQFGNTIDVHDSPVDLTTARTFADPPLNTAEVVLRGSELQFEGQSLGRVGTALSDGSYTLAFRAHHVSLSSLPTHSASVLATVGTSEITGSETYLHARAENGNDWVVLAHGVHRIPAGERVSLHLDPSRFYLFDESDTLVSSPRMAAEGV